VPVAVEAPARPTRPARGSRTARSAADQAAPEEPLPPDPALLEALRAWRTAEARRRGVPAYCVLSNRTIEGIAGLRPRDERALLSVRGVGAKVVEQFGEAILGLVRGVGSV